MQKGTGQLVKPHELRRVRRDIARVNTVLNEKSKEGTAA
jgi:large subunit ribosomal protein L29